MIAVVATDAASKDQWRESSAAMLNITVTAERIQSKKGFQARLSIWLMSLVNRAR